MNPRRRGKSARAAPRIRPGWVGARGNAAAASKEERYDESVDPLHRDDIDQARRTAPSERARQALEMMRVGFRLKRSALRARFPDDTEEQIETRFRRWLESDDRA